MINSVNELMLELQGALTARALYPAAHPRIRSGEERACELLQDVLREHPDVTVFAVEERVIFDDKVLPASEVLVETLFGPLSEGGSDSITFRRGIERREINSLLNDLAAEVQDRRRRLRATEHLAFGHIRMSGEVVGEDRVPRAIRTSHEMADALQCVWQFIYEEQVFDAATLGEIVSCVSMAANDSATAMLPLASIKRHDEYTFIHTINVTILSTAMAEALGIHGRTAHDLSMAALLHDVGKRSIPASQLNKKGRFTEEEFRIMQQHPVEGARILLNTASMPPLAPVVAYEHHVRADGSGYPRVPRGWKLNLASRIVQLADVFDALRAERPYRPALPMHEVVETMRRDVGVFFDHDLLEVFLNKVVFPGGVAPDAGIED